MKEPPDLIFLEDISKHPAGVHPDIWKLLSVTSRTFYISIRQLPSILGEPICLAYLLLRVSDFFEDNLFMQPEEKLIRLTQWDQILAGEPFPGDWKDTLLAYIESDAEALPAYYAEELLQLMKQYPVDLVDRILLHVGETTRGMARWIVQGPRVIGEDDMNDYMHEVAGRVGYLVTEVFARHSRTIRKKMDFLMPLARETGLALQTVNILRGLRKDYERGWIYVPESFCLQAGLTREQFFEPENRQKAIQVVEMLADKSERHLASAMRYVKEIPAYHHKMRLAIIWPILFAARTVSICRNNLSVLTGEAKVTRKDIKNIIRNTSLFGWSNVFLDNYYKHLISIPNKSA